MRKLLNTLFVTTPDCYLSLDGNNVVLLQNNKNIFRIPTCNIEGIICFNYLGASPQLMKHCSDNNIHISFISPNGRYMAGVTGKIHGNVLLRKKQYFMSENEQFCLNISKSIIVSKIFNSRYEVNRTIRDYSERTNLKLLESISEHLKNSILLVKECNNFDDLRGIEGEAAKQYFTSFNEMIQQQKTDFSFYERTKRPPLDNINTLLSFGYSLLAHDVEAALLSVGLDPYVGFLHTDRPGRISLALDIMEEFRSYFVDRFIISLINLKIINKDHFLQKESEGIILTNEGRKSFLNEWQKRKQEEIKHPFIEEKVKIGLIPYIQSLLLSRYLRNEIDNYPPFMRI